MSAMLDRIDKARATFRGVTLVGHRDSLKMGRMLWALPGGEQATTMALAETGLFEKVEAPLEADIKAYTKRYMAEAA